MQPLSMATLLPVLQTAIGPVILISGIGLLLLTMTNRFARLIDRSRVLASQFSEATDVFKPGIQTQIDIMFQRVRLLKYAIALLAISALTSAILIIVIFLSALGGVNDAWVIAMLFVGSMVFLSVSLILFITDINFSLLALKLEMKSRERSEA